jgi:hypothetical protein
MGHMGLRTDNHCTSEGQHQFSSHIKSPPKSPSVKGESPVVVTPLFNEEEAALVNMHMSRREQKSFSWILMGMETKNYCSLNSF